jgi:hypothetical protein
VLPPPTVHPVLPPLRDEGVWVKVHNDVDVHALALGDDDASARHKKILRPCEGGDHSGGSSGEYEPIWGGGGSKLTNEEEVGGGSWVRETRD